VPAGVGGAWAAKYLQTHYDLGSVHFGGTSAGALVAATLLAGAWA